MADQVSVEEVAETMFKMVKDAQGQKKLKPMDLQKAMIGHFGADRCDDAPCTMDEWSFIADVALPESFFRP